MTPPAVRTMLAAVAAALALAAALGAAPAAAEWIVKGRGFGHGVGLSQYGAYGFAQHGRTYKQILRHYYTGTEIGRAEGGRIRVLLGARSGPLRFRGARRACGRRLRANRPYAFLVAGGRVALAGRGGRRLRSCGREGAAAGGGTVRIAGFGRYRGALVARADGGQLLVINRVGVEAYVRGVVANEVPASWPREALRAQAVVARSYGLATERSGAFDHYDDTRSQVYEGVAAETPRTDRAVRATRHEVVEYRGRTAITYYHSTSGGRTESSEYGFAGGRALPYLKSVRDPFDDASPVHRWRLRLSDSELESELRGLFAGRLRRIEVVKTGRSPRIVRARVVGSRDSSTVSGETLRNRLGLRSTWARFRHR